MFVELFRNQIQQKNLAPTGLSATLVWTADYLNSAEHESRKVSRSERSDVLTSVADPH